jgi:isochorismate synthase
VSAPQLAFGGELRERRAPEVSGAELAQFVRHTLLAPVSAPCISHLVMPLPKRFAPTALLGALRGVDAWYLQANGTELLGLGAVRKAEPTGEGRFHEAQRAIEGWARELATFRHPSLGERVLGDKTASTPRAFVGFAFAPGAADQAMWAPFGDAVAVLPRWSLSQGPSGGLIELHVARSPDVPLSLETLLAELAEILGAQTPPPSDAGAVVVENEPPELHQKRVRAALAEIEKGTLGKVVVARRAAIFADRDLDATSALFHFLERAEEGAVYFVRRAGSVLLGVTPERLLAVRDHALETEALAGTAAVGQDALLRASDKDREEHRFVIASIEDALLPLAERIEVASAPEIATAGSVVHLKTKITATLRAEIHPLEVAAALHPTSAVGGTPKAAASAWIARTEPDRGWYGGPLGWVDAQGNGELFVALRGGVIRGACAWTFAGGGIVRGSLPATELEEAKLKMGGFLRALGAP